MGEYILVAYSEIKMQFAILGSGSFDEMTKLHKTLIGSSMLKLHVTDKPTDVTLQELVSNQKLLAERYGYIKEQKAQVKFDLEKDMEVELF